MNNIEEAIELTNRQIDELESELKTLETKEYVDAFNLAIDVKKLSVEALQEKLEREKGCKMCSNFAFKYCPHCGRKLGENNEHVHN